MGGACSTNAREEEIERPRRRWVDNIIMDLGRASMGWCGPDWSG
jgi:hypothetical protein